MAGKASLLLALGMPKKHMPDMHGGGGDEEEVDTGAEARTTAAKDIIAAVKSGDYQALDDALSRHYEACEHGAEESEESDDSEED